MSKTQEEQARESLSYAALYLGRGADAGDKEDWLQAIWNLSVAQNNIGEAMQAISEKLIEAKEAK